ncbi:hypothetical protein D3C72_1939550 [compost metagenome]
MMRSRPTTSFVPKYFKAVDSEITAEFGEEIAVDKFPLIKGSVKILKKEASTKAIFSS